MVSDSRDICSYLTSKILSSHFETFGYFIPMYISPSYIDDIFSTEYNEKRNIMHVSVVHEQYNH